AEVLPCYRSGAFGACALALAGAEFGHGDASINQAKSHTLPYLGLGGRLLAEIHVVGPFSLRLQADVLVTALGGSFYVGPIDLWDTPPVGFEGALVGVFRL